MCRVYAGLFSSIDGVVERPNEWQPRHADRHLPASPLTYGSGSGT
jgi:hypothetical protein